MKTHPLKYLSFMYVLALLIGCDKTEVSPLKENTPLIIKTKAPETPETFDWENLGGKMPTPQTQLIRVPWYIDDGCLSAFYEPDIVYDYKKIDGWRLVYSSFRTTGPDLKNPYFALYNIYRGTLRIYRYMNNISYSNSTYMECAIGLNGNRRSSILNFLGEEIVDATKKTQSFKEIMPKPFLGGAPLTNDQWYMVEYELAYDPSLKDASTEDIWLEFKTDSYNISSINIGGSSKTSITGTIGASSSSSNLRDKMWGLVKKEKSTAANGIVGIIGSALLNKHIVEGSGTYDGSNDLGFNKTMFKDLLSGVTSMTSAFYGGIPKLGGALLNAVFGGSSGSSPQAVTLKGETTYSLVGTASDNSVVNFSAKIIPGIATQDNIDGQLPLYNKLLGIVNYEGNDCLNIVEVRSRKDLKNGRQIITPDPLIDTSFYPDLVPVESEPGFIKGVVDYYPPYKTFSRNLIFNPEVKKIADISVVSEEVVEKTAVGVIPNRMNYRDAVPGRHHEYGIRFLIEIKPKDGSPVTFIIKTFKVNTKITTIYL